MSDGVFCPECGSENLKTSKFCMECGNNLEGMENYLEENANLAKDEFGSKVEILGLSPAESLQILDPEARGRDMLKYTMIDLMARGVIGIDGREVEKGVVIKKNVMEYRVFRGKNFGNPDLKPHEKIFQDVLSKKQEYKLKRYIQKLLKKINRKGDSGSFSKYQEKFVRDYLADEGYYNRIKKKVARIIPYTNYELSDYGLSTKNQIQEFLDEGKNLDYWMENDPERAKAFLAACGTHILLEGHDLNVIHKYNQVLFDVKPKNRLYRTFLGGFDRDEIFDNMMDNLDLNLDLDFAGLDLDQFYNDFDSGMVDVSSDADGDAFGGD